MISLFPLFGNFLGSVTSFIFALVVLTYLIFQSFGIATPCALLTIAIAWLWYRPVIGAGLLVFTALVGGGIAYFIHFEMNQNSQ